VCFGIPHPTLGEDIAAAIVCVADHDTSAADLSAYVASRLAEFKVPRRFVFVKEIPRGPTGKFRRLELHKLLGEELDDDYVPPVTASEKTLAEVLRRALGVERVGLTDGYMGLGGDSLRAFAVASAARRAGLALDATDLLTAPTVAVMAARVAERTASGNTDRPEMNRPAELDSWLTARQRKHPLVAGFLAAVAAAQEYPSVLGVYPALARQKVTLTTARHFGADQVTDTLDLRLEGEVDARGLERACAATIDAHEALRVGFIMADPTRPLQFVAREAAAPAFRCFDLSELAPAEQERQLLEIKLEDQRTAFDRLSPPLTRFSLCRLGPKTHRLIWTVHDGLRDRWSAYLILADIPRRYDSPDSGSHTILDYTDYLPFAACQLADKSSERHWVQLLAGFNVDRQARACLVASCNRRWSIDGPKRLGRVETAFRLLRHGARALSGGHPATAESPGS
jgi:aryl carrier-like protein